MKISTLFKSFLLLALFPSYLFAQEIKLPAVEISVNQDLVPLKVKDAFLNDFGTGHAPFAWVTNSTAFNTEGWVRITDPDLLDVNSYSLFTRASNGSTLRALYTSEGKLLNAREDLRNIKPSNDILRYLIGGEYQGWSLKKGHKIVKHLSDGSVKERSALVMVRGNEKKTIVLDENGKTLADKKGSHLELADLAW